jgi:hypothetical protein
MSGKATASFHLDINIFADIAALLLAQLGRLVRGRLGGA